MDFLTLIIIVTILLLVEGFFSGTEMAVVNAEKYRLAIDTDKGSKRARMAMHLVKHPAWFFSATLFGTNVCTISLSVVTTFYLISNYGEAYASLAIVIWPFTLILGEMVPKSVYQYYADRLVLIVSPILIGFSWLCYPLIWPLSKLTDFLLGGLKARLGTEPPLTRQELELMMEEEVGQGLSDMKPVEKNMISCILDLAESRVENIMTPLIDIVSVSVDAKREEAANLLEQSGYSRLPVYSGRSFNIIGVLNNMDLLFSDSDKPIKELIHKAYYVPENMPLDVLLLSMKRKGEPVAIAVDEFGSATGLVTTEDLLEEVVGDIKDEHDEVGTLYQRQGYYHYLINGRLEIEDANERLKLNIPDGDYETIAGFLIEKAEHIPKPGEKVLAGGFEYLVLRANDKAILEVEVKKI
ncbi:MAG: hemolysin family protein [Pseudomonadota bacterium]